MYFESGRVVEEHENREVDERTMQRGIAFKGSRNKGKQKALNAVR